MSVPASRQQLYYQLVHIGYDEDTALVASQKCSTVNEAIAWISKISSQYLTPLMHGDDMNYTDLLCDAHNVTKCNALHRIISMLSTYGHIIYCSENEISKFIDKHRTSLIEDFHHILEKHLNDDTLSRQQTDKQFTTIYQLLQQYNLYCDIEKCTIYSRNNRLRETSNLQLHDGELVVFIDLIDTIHCYFLHSVDTGFRLISPLHKVAQITEQKSENNSYDVELHRLQTYLTTKCKQKLAATRGKERMSHNKFLTHFPNAVDPKLQQSTVELVDEQEDEKKNEDSACIAEDAEASMVMMEGYLQKQSLHVKQFRKRFIILRNERLYCYKNHKKADLTECIHLISFKRVSVGQTEVAQFQLIPIDSKDSIRVFQCSSMHEVEEWVKYITECLSPSAESEHEEKQQRKTGKVFSFGERRDYWHKRSKMSVFSNSMTQSAKYKSVKEEVISNKIYSIDMNEFNNAYNKANFLVNASRYLSGLRSDAFGDHVQIGQPPSIENILSVVLYTDYDALSYRFSSTFRKILHDETEKYRNKRNAEFWNWSKLLIETVNAFGSTLKDSEINVFYHGVSFVYFDSFIAAFNAPTSTTPKVHIAQQFATKNGIIVGVGRNMHHSWSGDIKYFNCSFVSCYANEDERLFIQSTYDWQYLDILSIRNVAKCENYTKYVHAINILQRLTEYNFDKRLTLDSSISISNECVSIINDMIGVLRSKEMQMEQDGMRAFPKYVAKSLQKCTEKVSKLSVALKTIQKYASEIAFYDTANEVVRVDILQGMFRNVEEIWLWDIQCETLAFWNSMAAMLEIINNTEYSKLNRICIHRDTKVFGILVQLHEYQVAIAPQQWRIVQLHAYSLELEKVRQKIT